MTTISPKTDHQLKTVQLVSSLFEWPSTPWNSNLQDFDVKLEVSYVERPELLKVYVNISCENESGNILDDFYLEVEMVGIFEKRNLLQSSSEEFIRVEAAEIIFPYIHRHICAVCLDTGFTPIKFSI